jgi:hypothetical protein
MDSHFSRRRFIKTTLATTAATFSAPAIVTAAKTDTNPIVGSGDYQYEVHHHFPQLPDKYKWMTTHNVAFDSEGLLYVIHEGKYDLKDHPTIFVFDSTGKFVRAFGEQFNGGGHGLEIRKENGQDFLYVCAYQQQRSFAKLTTDGKQIWRKGAPMESGIYAAGEDKFPRAKDDNPWDRNRFIPTNIAFLPDGGFYVIDGYGGYCVHRYDADANWLSTFGSVGEVAERKDGTFKLPHGIWIDSRGEETQIVVADREFDRLQWFSLDGQHRQTLDGFRWPANIDIHGDVMVVPELVARTTLLDKNNIVIAHLGTDSERIQKDKADTGGFNIRTDEAQWENGKFVHPHDACFDADGNIYVAEWVATGRVTKLLRLT